MKTVKDLNGTDLLIVEARKIKGGKVQLTFAQQVANPNVRPTSIASLLNASDERFTQSAGVRYSWMSGAPADIKASLGIDVADLQNEGDKKELGILNPEIGGKGLNIQITEVDTPTEYEEANFETAAKRAGKGGDFILTSEGKYIFVRATVVAGNPKHAFIANTVRALEYAGPSDDNAEDSAIEDELRSS